MRLPWECHNQSRDTNWRHCVTGPELPFFLKRKGVLKIDQSVKMPWHKLSMGVASSCSSAPACIHNSIYAQLKVWTNSFTTERHSGSAIVIERKILIRNKKVNKRAYGLAKHTPHFYFNLPNAQLASFFRPYFYCSLDQVLKSQCRWKNWTVLRSFLPYFIMMMILW